MIGRLYSYFGLLGGASIVAWLAALILLVVFLRHRQRGRVYLFALGLAVVGFVLAEFNSSRVSAIHLEEVAPPAQPTAEEISTEAGVPAYRQMGKQSRTAGKAAVSETVEEKSPERSLQEAQLLEANRFDRWNLLGTRGALLLVLLGLAADYLARFNRTTGHSYPLPIAGHWLDRVFPKSRTVLAGALDTKTYLETVVRRGETFLYFTGNDPWNTATLPRLGKLWQLPKIVYSDPPGAEFYFDAVWFNRYGVIVLPADANSVLEQLEVYLEWRRRTKAVTRQTVHVVWDLPAAPPAELLERLILLFAEANFKLIVKAVTGNRVLFDEVHG